MADLVRKDVVGAVRHARRCVDQFPRHAWALAILRDADVRSGRDDVALARYVKAYPELFEEDGSRVSRQQVVAPSDVALLYQRRGDSQPANALINATVNATQAIPRLGDLGYGIADVRTHALRGNNSQALALLRQAEQTGWRLLWRYYRDFDPALDSIERPRRSRSPWLAVAAATAIEI
jgi:hypothetical protein